MAGDLAHRLSVCLACRRTRVPSLAAEACFVGTSGSPHSLPPLLGTATLCLASSEVHPSRKSFNPVLLRSSWGLLHLCLRRLSEASRQAIGKSQSGLASGGTGWPHLLVLTLIHRPQCPSWYTLPCVPNVTRPWALHTAISCSSTSLLSRHPHLPQEG